MKGDGKEMLPAEVSIVAASYYMARCRIGRYEIQREPSRSLYTGWRNSIARVNFVNNFC